MDLRGKEEELKRGVEPIERELHAVDEELQRMASEFVRGALGEKKLDGMRHDVESRQRALREQLDALGPDLLDELERTRRLLRGAEEWRAIAERRAELGIPTDSFVWLPQMAESDEVSEFREEGLHGLRLDFEGSSGLLTRLLDWLQAEVIVFHDSIQVRGLIPVTAALSREADQDIPYPSHDPRGERSEGARSHPGPSRREPPTPP